MRIDYRAPPKDQQVSLLARTLPDGRLWNAKYDRTRVLGRLVAALAPEIARTYELIETFVLKELDPSKTRQLLLEWEESAGIPDDCFDRSADLDERRRRVVQKLSNFGGVITKDDIEGLLLDFGEQIQLVPGNADNAELLGFPAPPYSTNQLKQIKHTLAVRVASDAAVFPLPFPIQFAGEQSTLLQCLMRRIAPANVDLRFFFNQNLSQPLGGPNTITAVQTLPAPTQTADVAVLVEISAAHALPAPTQAATLAGPTTPVAVLDAMADTGAVSEAAAGSFAVSAGTNRLLVLILVYRGSVDTISGASYGGQAMASQAFADGVGGFPAHVRIFTLDDAGIDAAVDDDFGVTGDTNGRYRSLAASFENVDQANPVVDADTLTGDLSAGTINLTSMIDGFAVAAGGTIDSSTFDWTAITERVGTESDGTMSYTGASGATAGVSIDVDPDTSSSNTEQAAAAITLRPA